MKKALAVIAVILILALAAGTYYYFFIPNNKVVRMFDPSKTNLVVEGDVIKSKDGPLVEDGEVLLPFETVKSYIDPNIYWDENLKKVTVTTKDKVIRMKTGSLEAYVNNKPVTLNFPVTEVNGVTYLPISFLSDFYRIDITYIQENNLVVIDYHNSIRQLAEPLEEATVRLGRSIRFPIVRKLTKDGLQAEGPLRIFEEYKDWYKVRTHLGEVGYVRKDEVVVKRMLVPKLPEEETPYKPWKPEEGKLNLVWELYSPKLKPSQIQKMNGVDVISPTWFALRNGEGDVDNKADPVYVKWAHDNGYRVWGLFSNNFDPEISREFLNNTDARENAIRQILSYASLYKLDGINVDFESFAQEERDAFVQLLREMMPLLKEQNLTLSVDINMSAIYDRKAIGEVVDYVMLMAYDQHWRTSPVAGSVAQITWVENILVRTLADIPRGKLVLGIPFYTRLWEEKLEDDGALKVTHVKALSMKEAEEIVNEKNALVTWEEVSGQFYVEYQENGATYKLWMEEVNSINLKSSLALKYDLAGVAIWKRSDGVPEVWEVIEKNVKKLKSYNEWSRENLVELK